MVKFRPIPCDIVPNLNVTCSKIALDAKIIYPSSYNEKRTTIQETIESYVGFKERFPTINIGEMQLYLRKGNVIESLNIYFGRVKKENFNYEESFECGPFVSLAMLGIDTQQDDLYFKEQVSVKIDREKRVICINFGERKEIYQTFSLADDLLVHADKDNNLAGMVFRNFRWIDIETEPSIPWQHTSKKRSLFFALIKYLRKLF